MVRKEQDHKAGGNHAASGCVATAVLKRLFFFVCCLFVLKTNYLGTAVLLSFLESIETEETQNSQYPVEPPYRH